MSAGTGPSSDYEYIVVGSGAGGGTLAARLADRALLLRGKLQIDGHLFTYIN